MDEPRPAPRDKSWLETEELRGDGRTRTLLGWWRDRRRKRDAEDMHRVGFALSVMQGTAAMDVMRSTGLSSGRVEDALRRLERAGAVTVDREPGTRRRLYKQVWP